MTTVLIHSESGIPASRARRLAISKVSSSPLNFGNSAVSFPYGDVWPERAKWAMGSRSFLAAALVKLQQRVAEIPSGRFPISVQQTRDMALPGVALLGDLNLRQPGCDEVLNDIFPVHESTISLLRFSCNRQSGRQKKHNGDMNTFGSRTKKARMAAGLTQKQLAKAAGLSQTTISDIERDRNSGSGEVVTLARVLGVTAEYLASNIGPMVEAKLQNGTVVGMFNPNVVSKRLDPDIAAVVALMEGTDERGRILVLGAAREALKHHNPAVKNRAK